jgi:hypothetical protein
VRIVSPDSFTAQDEARNPTSAVPLPQTSTEPFYRTASRSTKWFFAWSPACRGPPTSRSANAPCSATCSAA